MIVLSNKDVAALLPTATAIEVVQKAMVEVSAGRTNLPLRSIMDVGGPNRLGLMPGSMSDPACYGVKLVSLFPGNPDAGHSSHQGAMVLFEAQHGAAIAMMNAGLLTAVRTAAASAVATRALAREDSSVLALIGAGEQAEFHLDAMAAVRPIREVRVAAPRLHKVEAFIAHTRSRHGGIEFSAMTNVREAVAGADIVCTVTSAPEPILFGEWIGPGTHLNVAGASIPSRKEIDGELVAKSSLFVDYRASTFAQAGEVIDAIKAGLIAEGHVKAEIGEVIAGEAAARSSRDEITLYRSLGIAAQDIACAAHCLAEARKQGRGVHAPID